MRFHRRQEHAESMSPEGRHGERGRGIGREARNDEWAEERPRRHGTRGRGAHPLHGEEMQGPGRGRRGRRDSGHGFHGHWQKTEARSGRGGHPADEGRFGRGTGASGPESADRALLYSSRGITASAGRCPLCNKRCPLSAPGCPKGAAHARSLAIRED